MENNAIGGEGGVHGAIDKLSPITGLEALNGKAELCAGISNKVDDTLMYNRFMLKRECPTLVRKIIQQNQIIKATSKTSNR